jgi:HK97 family phage major capsid protein
VRLTHSQAVNRLKSIEGELNQLAEKDHLSRSENLRMHALGVEADEVNEHVKGLERGHDLARGRGGSRIAYEGEGSGVQPYRDRDADDSHDPARGHRDTAMRCVDGLVSAGRLPARSAETVEGLVKTGNPSEQGHTARTVAALGSDAYTRAFAKLVANPSQGHLTWTAQESEAFRTVEQLRSETRAMSTVDTLGGYLIPLQIDPAILITSAGSINPLRQISRVVTTSADTWSGVTSAGVTAEWIAEGLQVADASPALAQPTIPVYKADAFVPFSFEVAMDGILFMDELGKLLVDGYQQLCNTAFTTGSGVGQPTGIVTALAAATGSVVNTGTGGTLAATDIWNLQNQLPARFSVGAEWCSHLATMNAIRQFVTGSVLTFPSMQNDPPTLLGRNANELSNMASALTHTNYVLVYGKFSEAFCIVDRWPSSLELIPNLFGAQGRPTGQRGAFLWARVGSDVVIPNALRLLAT